MVRVVSYPEPQNIPGKVVALLRVLAKLRPPLLSIHLIICSILIYTECEFLNLIPVRNKFSN
jgi:hypothetical protein